MSKENVEIVRRAFEAVDRGDLDGAVADFDPNAEYISTGVLLEAGESRGPEEFKRLISWIFDTFDDTQVEPKDFVDAGEKVVGEFTLSGRGKGSGVETSWTLWQVWTLKDRKVVHGQGFTTREEALEAAGLSE